MQWRLISPTTYSLADSSSRRDSTWSDRVCPNLVDSSFATTLRFLGATHCALVLVTCSLLYCSIVLAVSHNGYIKVLSSKSVKSNAATSTSILAPDSSSTYPVRSPSCNAASLALFLRLKMIHTIPIKPGAMVKLRTI